MLRQRSIGLLRNLLQPSSSMLSADWRRATDLVQRLAGRNRHAAVLVVHGVIKALEILLRDLA